jgi:ABC-type antimicrobial peptide transport system permease subunit
MNMHVDYGVVKSFIQLGYKFRRDTHAQVSFFANLLTICIACLVSPHHMYHIVNLYRGIPIPSPAVFSKAALGFWLGQPCLGQWGEYMD